MIGYLTQNYSLIHAFAEPAPAHRTRREALATSRIFKMAPKLSDYFHDGEILAVKGSLDRPISGLVIDSRRVVPGTLFFALPGLRADGASFIDEAVSRGAVAIVTQKLPALPPAKVTFIQVADARATLANVAQRFYKFPDREMTVVGVTGTNGKTTVTHLLKHFLNGDQRVGLLGTISYDLGGRTVPSFRTTPEALDIYGMMAQMRDAGCRHAVMEVSSHGIDQQRVRGLQFGAAVFTNLTRDHLDYHGTMEAYAEAKFSLFGLRGLRHAVINVDDAHGERFAERLEGSAIELITYGTGSQAKLRASSVQLSPSGVRFAVEGPWGRGSVNAAVLGAFNVSNLLAVLGTLIAAGVTFEDAIAAVSRLQPVTGRLDRVGGDVAPLVVIDYAHTPDALEKALQALRPAVGKGRRLVCVFGCGGDRDPGKRPMMGRVAASLADHVVVTSDNPRGEAPRAIIDQILGGMPREGVEALEDRQVAIFTAVSNARPGDVILLAGKGHETYQEIAGVRHPFSDREVATAALAQWDGAKP